MIKFNGIDLEELVNVKIDDIHVNPIQITPQARQRVGMGQDFVRMNGGNRTIVVTFAILEEDKEERFRILQAITEWARPFESGPLILPMDETKYFECRCTGYPEPSYRQWWESKLRLTFSTFENPYWTSLDENRATCGVSFSVGGTAPPLMKIQRSLSGRAANQSYSCNGNTMTFSLIPAGKMEIDLNKQTAVVSNSSIMQYFNQTGNFIVPVIGNMRITGVGNILYRERWV